MQNVTDRTSNPFGMSPPTGDLGRRRIAYGYGDANADFHLIGDHPGVHGGETTGVPFTDSIAGERLQPVFHETGFLAEPYSDRPTATNLFMSYLHMVPPSGPQPTPEEYADLERFFDAELRAINAHILMPVGATATDHVLREYTTQSHRLDLDMPALHASQIRGRGFLVVPIEEPAEWIEGDRERLTETLRHILDSDYRQTKGVATMVG